MKGIHGVSREFFSSPPHADRLWGPPNLLTNGYRRLLPGVKVAGGGINFAIHLHLVPTLRIHGAIPPFPNTSS